MSDLIGYYHKIRMRCDYCGDSNPNGMTYVIRNEELSGNFCSEQHAQYARKEMQKGGVSDEEDVQV